MDFRQAEALFRTCRNPQAGKPLPGRATRLFRRDSDTYAIRYHQTDVVTIHRDGTYTLATGGWDSPTTRSKFQQFGPSDLRVSGAGGRICVYSPDWELRVPVGSGLRVNACGRPIPGWPGAPAPTADAAHFRARFSAA